MSRLDGDRSSREIAFGACQKSENASSTAHRVLYWYADQMYDRAQYCFPAVGSHKCQSRSTDHRSSEESESKIRLCGSVYDISRYQLAILSLTSSSSGASSGTP